MKSYKSLDAHNYFQSGWVQTVYIILKPDVRPSHRVNEEPHHLWVALSADGTVAVAHCNYMAGLAESCSHIGALLLKIEGAVRPGYTELACTDLPYKWNEDFVKKVQLAEIKTVMFYNDKSVAKTRKPKPAPVYSNFQEQQTLLQSLAKCNSNPIVLSTFNNSSDKFHWKNKPAPGPVVPPTLRSLYKEEYNQLDSETLAEKCLEIMHTMEISNDSINYIQNVTKNQSSSLTWHEQRFGRINSPKAFDALHTTPLIKSICNPQFNSLDHVPVIKWGKEEESIALEEYTVTMQTIHKKL